MLLQDFLREAVAAQFGGARGADKEFAARLHDALESTESLSFATVRTRVSKLLAGSPDGRAFFWDAEQPHRTAILAATLDVDRGEMQRLVDQWVLVVDPRIPREAVDFLRERQPFSREQFGIVVTAEGADPRIGMRDEARRHLRPLVLLRSYDDAPYFEGAGVDCSTLYSVDHCWRVDTKPNLYDMPLPPLFGAGGHVLVPVANHPQLGALRSMQRRSYQDNWAEYLCRQVDEGRSPTANLEQATAWFRCVAEKDCEVRLPDVAEALSEPRTPHVWEVDGVVYANESIASTFATFLAPYHAVMPPPWIAPLRALEVQWCDPWQVEARLADEGDPLMTALCQAVRAVGPWTTSRYSRRVDDGWPALRTELQKYATSAIKILSGAAKGRLGYSRADKSLDLTVSALNCDPGPLRQATKADLDNAAVLLDRLASHGAEPTAYGIAILRALDLAHHAPTLVADTGAGQQPEYAFDLGAGHIIKLRVASLLGTPSPLKRMSPQYTQPLAATTVLWGGDILVQIHAHRFEILEGANSTSAAGPRRRRESEVRAADDDDD